LPLMKRPSLEHIVGALKSEPDWSGPDGNDLRNDCDWKKEWRDKLERTRDERGMIGREPLDRRGGETGGPLRRQARNKTYHRAFTSPVGAWKDLRSPLYHFSDDANDDCEYSGVVNGSRRNNTNDHFNRHCVTITNATGADLAKEVKILMGRREGGIAGGPADGTMTPNRLRFRAWRTIKSSKAVANAGELVLSPVRSVRNTGQRAAKLVRKTRQKLKERKELRRQRRLARLAKRPPRSWWIVIPADHPYKIAWDVLTMLWALLGAYRTHVRIRDRVFDQSPLIILTEVWFTVDILLNFVTEHKTRRGEVIRDGKAVWARYLTTWFVIDILSLIPWERIYVAPVVERIKRRNFFQKTFFRSKAVVRVSRLLRGRHIKLFGRVSKRTGTPLRRMATLAIKYVPKYLVFLRNMKGAMAVRALRFVHWLHNMYKKIWVKARDAARWRGRAMGHPIFSLVGRRADEEIDSDSDGSEDDEDDDEISESLDEDEYDDLVLLNDSLVDDSDCSEAPLTNFRRSVSEGVSPLRRSFSQSELWRRG